MTTSRAVLEAMRARGRRLVASDAELLDDHDNAASYFCAACHQYFASPCAEVAVMDSERRKHIESESHKRHGGAM